MVNDVVSVDFDDRLSIRVEERGTGVGIGTPKSDLGDSFENDQEVSLAGFDNKGYILTTVNDVINWSRTGSLYWMTFGLACCAVEMMHTSIPRYDLERFGAIQRVETVRFNDCSRYSD